MTPRVQLETVEGVGVISLTDAARRNVIDSESSRALAFVVGDALAQGIGALILRAEPPVFCAGGSLDDLLDLDADLGPLYEGFLALASAPVPTIAAVDAACIGAGMNLPLCCDVVLVTDNARFDPRFLDVGIHPGGAHLWRLIHRVGYQGAAALVLLGEVLNGRDAVEYGLAWKCTGSEELIPLALKMAKRSVARPAALVQRTKQTLRSAMEVQTEQDAVLMEAEAQSWSRQQPGFTERIMALQARLQ
jgi:enoyl-CoA hydratase